MSADSTILPRGDFREYGSAELADHIERVYPNRPDLLEAARRVRETVQSLTDEQIAEWVNRALGAEKEVTELQGELVHYKRHHLSEHRDCTHSVPHGATVQAKREVTEADVDRAVDAYCGVDHAKGGFHGLCGGGCVDRVWMRCALEAALNG